MSIRKRNRKYDCNYTMMGNTIREDARLQLQDVGLFFVMWSLPDDWDFSINGMATYRKNKNDGPRKIRSCLKRLIDAGYVKRFPERDSFGKITNWIYEFDDLGRYHDEADGNIEHNLEVPQPHVPCVHVDQEHVDPETQTKKQETNNLKKKETTTNDQRQVVVALQSSKMDMMESAFNHTHAKCSQLKMDKKKVLAMSYKSDVLREFGFSATGIEQLLQQYSFEKIRNNVEYVKSRIAGGKVKSPGKYLISALKNDYAATAVKESATIQPQKEQDYEITHLPGEVWDEKGNFLGYND